MPAPPPRELLLTPGPTPVPPDVVAAMARAAARTTARPSSRPCFGSVLERLKPVFRTERDVMLFTSSGTGAFESAYANLAVARRPRPRGRRRGQLRRALGQDGGGLRRRRSRRCAGPWGERPDPDAIAERVTAATTSRSWSSCTPRPRPASVLDLQAVAERTRERSALLVVDAISSLGAAPLETDAWGLDVVVTGSQKALMLPPGPGLRGGLRARAGALAARPPARASTSTGSARSTRSARARRAPSRRPSR